MSEMHAHARGAATLHDVAREAGVSLATASRVLNGSTRVVAESYRVRVETAAEKLGYTANLSAQATARGTAAIVALIVPDVADPAFSRLAAGVVRGADEAGFVVTIATTEGDPRREARLVHALRGQRPRGLILADSRVGPPDGAGLGAELEAFAGMGGRIVVLGARPAVDGSAQRSVGADDRGGAAELGAELARRGYRDSVIVAFADGVRRSDERLNGFTEGFTALGGAVPHVERGGVTRDAGYAVAQRLLERGLAKGTVIFAVSDVVAIGVIAAVRDAGREVGADIAVAGFDDIAAACDIRPGLTSVRVPIEELGLRALHAAIHPDAGDAVLLPVDVVMRDSTPPRD